VNELKNIHIIEPQMEKIFKAYWDEGKWKDDDSFAHWLLRHYNITYLTASEKGLWVQGDERDLMMLLLKF